MTTVRRMRRSVTFVGPIQELGPARKKHWVVLVMQTGTPIQLEYDSEAEAQAARRAFLQAPNAFSVPSVRLLFAVHKAIQAAISGSLANSEAETETA